ncbi:MAG: PQQ-binding-like beta-propeller repeat protein [Bryobacteraceae bacterium]
MQILPRPFPIHTTLMLILSGAAPAATAADWPQWRGPASQGVSTETALPTTWSDSSNVAWKAPLAGFGASSPIVVDGLIVTTSQVGSYQSATGEDPRLARDDRSLASRENAIGAGIASTSGKPLELAVEAFRIDTGKPAWTFRMPATGPRPDLHEKHNLATPTPVSDGERIYAWFGNGQLAALDLDGKPVWRHHLGLEHGSFLNQWGHGSSPLLYKDSLILLVDHRPVSYLLSLDKRTGKQRWKVDRGQNRVSHSTPVVVAGPNGDEMIVNSTERVDAYDPTTGELLWHAGSQRQTPIPTAVSHGGTIYMARGYRNSDILAIRSGGRGDVSETHIQYRIPNGGSYVPSILHYQGLLYMTNEVGVVTCADASTGERLWRSRLGGIFFASPVGAAGRVYLLSETGETYVLRAGREAELLATNRIDGRFLASPAISSGRIFLRSDGTLFAIGGREP